MLRRLRRAVVELTQDTVKLDDAACLVGRILSKNGGDFVNRRQEHPDDGGRALVRPGH